MQIEAFAQSFLTFIQATNTNIKGFAVEHFVVLTQSAKQKYLGQGLQSSLHLVSYASLSKTTGVSPSSTLTIQQDTQRRVTNEVVSHQLFLVSACRNEDKFLVPRQSLSLVGTAIANLAKGTSSTLTLSQAATFTHTKVLTATSSLVLRSSVTFYEPKVYFTSFEITVINP
jgi:hypothetical protein